MLLQLDGSPHDWLEGRGPKLTLLAAIDDATGTIAGAVWRAQEDSAGYLALIEQVVTRHGCPEAVYHDRSGIFVHHDHERASLAEQLAGEREPRQVARALHQLGIASVTAHSPQAKGRVERLFNTLQDRLVVELRLANATTQADATRVLAEYLPRFNARFAVPAAQPGSAYHPLPDGVAPRQLCCLIERRVVANDDTIGYAGQRLQLLPGKRRLTYVRASVEVRQHLDGTLSLWYGSDELAWRPAPADARTLRATSAAVGAEDRADLAPAPPPAPPAVAKPRKPAADHAWRAGYEARERTKSLTSSGDIFTG